MQALELRSSNCYTGLMEKMPEYIDPSIGRFKYSAEDRKRMLAQGHTEAEIDEKEMIANNKIAEKQLEEEERLAA